MNSCTPSCCDLLKHLHNHKPDPGETRKQHDHGLQQTPRRWNPKPNQSQESGLHTQSPMHIVCSVLSADWTVCHLSRLQTWWEKLWIKRFLRLCILNSCWLVYISIRGLLHFYLETEALTIDYVAEMHIKAHIYEQKCLRWNTLQLYPNEATVGSAVSAHLIGCLQLHLCFCIKVQGGLSRLAPGIEIGS